MALDRRSFLTFVAGGAAGTLFTPVIWKSIDDSAIWTQNWPWIPRLEDGPTAYKATTCKLCPAGCGLNIRTVGGRPVTAEGRADHPLSQGGICPLGAASVQMLYSPARIRQPMLKQEDGSHQPISWEQAEALLHEKLNTAKNTSDAVACISGDENGTVNELFSAMLAGMRSDRMFLMPGERLALNTACSSWLDQGEPGFDLENADLILAFGADILDSWGTVVRNQKVYGKAHPVGEDARAELVYAGSMQNGTGASADQWVPVGPGLEGVLALGIAYHLLQAGAVAPQASDFAAYRKLVLNRYTPEYVQHVTGLGPEQVAGLAEKLRKARKPVVLPGASISQGSSVFTVTAVLSLNFLLNAVNAPGGVVLLPALPQVVPGAENSAALRRKDVTAYLHRIAEGKSDAPAVLMSYEANPLFALPEPAVARKALEKTYLISFSTFYDETAAQADLLLPNSYFLERHDDVQTPHGAGFASYSLTIPATKPVFDTRPTGDVLLAVSQKMGMDLGFASFDKVLEGKAAALLEVKGFLTTKVQPWEARIGSVPAPISKKPWRDLTRGATWASLQGPSVGDVLLGAANLARTAPSAEEDWSYPLRLAGQDSRTFGSRHIAIPPFCLPLLGEQEMEGDTFFVRMSSATASKYGLRAGDLVKLTGPAGYCVAKLRIFEGVALNVVAAPLGFGHTAWDEFSRGKGDNIYSIMTVRTEPGSDLAVWADSRVRIAKAY